MNKKILLLLLAGLLTPPAALGTMANESLAIQQSTKQLRGTVLDENGEPVIGATVRLKGTSLATVTDIDGNFTINASQGTLSISYVGYKAQEVKASAGNPIKVSLKEDSDVLSEVVVVGYGTQKKASLTGSIEIVKGEALENRAISNVGTALQGQTPGLMITRTSSRPGNEGLNMTIRGATSVNGGSPLIIIDGVPALNSSAFTNLNSDDIESISVLKDGAASIYGAKAANGVILVTTKKGKGKVQVSYNFNLRFTTPGITSFSPSMQEYATMWIEANKEEKIPNWWGWVSEENMLRMQRGEEGIYTTQYWGDIFLGNANRMDELFARRNSYQHNISIGGATEKSDYRISAEYADNQANLATAYDGQKQFNLRLNYGVKLTDWLRVETSASMIKTRASSPSVGLDNSMYGYEPPFFPAKNPLGQWYANYGTVGDRQAVAATSDGGRDRKDNLLTRVDLKATVDIWKKWGIQAEVMASLQNNEYRRERYVIPVQTYDWFGNPVDRVIDATKQSLTNLTDPANIKAENNPGYLTQANNDLYQYYSALLRWNYTFNKLHKVGVMAGINAEKSDYKRTAAAREKFDAQGVYDLNLGEGTLANSGGKGHNGTFSYISRLNYSYADRYLVEVMARRDGNSKFAEGHRFKTFWSFMGGWVFSDEAFWKPISKIVNFGKIRLTYGSSGNDVGLSNYDYMSTINQGTSVIGQPLHTVTSSSLANNGLISTTRTWEKVEQKNVGIDLHFLNSRLTTSFDYFIKDNNGMLTYVTYPSVLGGTAPKTNSGHLNVKGWEFEIGWKDQVGDFQYNVRFNIGDTWNKLKEMEGADTYVAGKNATVNGYPLNSWFVHRTNGYFKDQAEVDRYYQLYGANGALLANLQQGSSTELRPGDVKRVDLNGDYTITADGSQNSDLQYVGDASPHYNFGINLGASWKGIDFSAFFQGVGKQYIMRSGWLAYPFYAQFTNQNPTFLGKTWTEENPNAEYPRLTTYSERAKWNYANNDFMLQSCSYLRLKSLVLGYTLPKQWTKKVCIDRLRVYFSGEDLWETTSIKDGFDPEMGESSNASGYPFARTWSFGVNITL